MEASLSPRCATSSPRCLLIPWLRSAALARLRRMERGTLLIREDGQEHRFGTAATDGLEAALVVRDARFWRELGLGGGLGAGEAWILGWWTSEDPVAVVRLLCRNRPVLAGLEGGLALLRRPALALGHWLRRNSRDGAARNIRAHYDLGNEFFALMLDETMQYSAAWYETPDTPLFEAQIAKMERICRKLDLRPGQHLLEIGTGWGGLALHAARLHGCRVTTTTISPAQHRLAVERVHEAGLADRVEVLLCDYRDLHGRYDRIVSIEMIEAIGHRQYPLFFRRCQDLLADDGLALIQAITIADREFERAKGQVDFIKRHIFPGCCIPSLTALQRAMTAASDLRSIDLEDITHHYVRTLADWRDRFQAARARLPGLGLDERFARMWEFYLSYCEGGFAERAIGDIQLVLARPDWRPAGAARAVAA